MQSGIMVLDNAITGRLKFIEGGIAESGPLSGDGYFLALKFSDIDPEATSVKEALEMACLLCGDDGIILAYGSLSYIGEFATLSETIAKKQDIKL